MPADRRVCGRLHAGVSRRLLQYPSEYPSEYLCEHPSECTAVSTFVSLAVRAAAIVHSTSVRTRPLRPTAP